MDITHPIPWRRLVALAATATALHALIAAAGLALPGAFGYAGKVRVSDDVRIYHRYAVPLLEGRLPYRDYPVEYPPLAIPSFAAPMVAGPGFDAYRVAFAVEMLLVDGAAVFLVARRVAAAEGIRRVPGRLAWYTLFFASLSPMIVARFDPVPMLLAFAGACALASGRPAVGGLVAGLGVLVKLVPGLVIVPFLAARGPWRPKVRGSMALSATLAVGGLAWWGLAGEGVLRSFRYHGERGLEIGSTYASAYQVAHLLAGVGVYTYFDHGSMNLAGPGARDAARLAPIVQAALLLLVAGRAREGRPSDPLRYSAAALLAYVAAGKVLSPQYLIWLIPFVAALGGPAGSTARRAFLACCVLTTAVYPWSFHALGYFEPWAVILLAARNLGLAALLATLLGRGRFGQPGGRGIEPTVRGADPTGCENLLK